MEYVSSRQFAFWRIGLGCYLVFFTLSLLPFSRFLFKRGGFIENSQDRLVPFFSEFFWYLNQSLVVDSILGGVIVCGVLIVFGVFRNWAALGAWIG